MVKKRGKKHKQAAVSKGPRQKPLPGMEDRTIESLNDAALHYDEVKKARMKLTLQEVEAKKEVAGLMKANKKKHYKHGNILVDIVPEGEKVKVKVLAQGEDEPEEDIETPTDAEIEAAEAMEEAVDPEEIEEEEEEPEEVGVPE